MALEQHAAATTCLHTAVVEAGNIELNRDKADQANFESIVKLNQNSELAHVDPVSQSMTTELEQLARETFNAAVNHIFASGSRHLTCNADLMQDILDHESNAAIDVFVPHCEAKITM